MGKDCTNPLFILKRGNIVKQEKNKFIWITTLLFILNKIIILIPSVYVNRNVFSNHSFFSAWKYLLFDNFSRWDSGGYLLIAKNGYYLKGTAFFPLYPLLIKVLDIVTHRPVVTGILISNVSFFFLIYFFMRLLRLDYTIKDTCKITLLLVVFPTSFYFSALYTESMFMLFSVLFLYFLRKGGWMRASIFGMLAGGTRNTGVLLALPFAIEFLNNHYKQFKGKLVNKKLAGILWGVFIPIIAFIYMGYLWIYFHDPFSFSHVQKLFGRGYMAPWNTLINGYVFNFQDIHLMPGKVSYLDFYYILELVIVSLIIIILILSFKKLRFSYWLIILYSILIPLTDPVYGKINDYFVSIPRYVLVIVPMYIALFEVFKRRILYASLVVLFTILLIVLSYYWTKYFWIA